MKRGTFNRFNRHKQDNMAKRYVSIWFRYFKTDWLVRRQPLLKDISFVMVSPDHGRMVVRAVSPKAEQAGIYISMSLADARAMLPALQYFDDEPDHIQTAITALAAWMIRYTPIVAVSDTDGLLLDASGCAHLWGGEKPYLTDIYKRLTGLGYHIRVSMADTVGCAWAVTHYAPKQAIIVPGEQKTALLTLPPQALRLQDDVSDRLEKLGLRNIAQFMDMPRPSLRRRFGPGILMRLDQALGITEENIVPVIPAEPYLERLQSIEPIVTAKGIEIALKQLLETLCSRLKHEEKGLRSAILTCYRVDGKTEQLNIGTNRPSRNSQHLFKLFEINIETIEPAMGIELFTLSAPKTEAAPAVQEYLWNDHHGSSQQAVAELLDRIGGKLGMSHIQRFLPDEHYLPEKSFRPAISVDEKMATNWILHKPRPLQLLTVPERIKVAAPVPDYPPMHFVYKGKLHKIVKADGPERIEQAWWLQEGRHRDYYYVEDEEGNRYWLFRSGHYDAEKTYRWFIHGFFV